MAEAGSEQGQGPERQQRRLRKQFNLAEQPADLKPGEPGMSDEKEEDHPFFRDPNILPKVNRHLRVVCAEPGGRGGGARAYGAEPAEPAAVRAQ